MKKILANLVDQVIIFGGAVALIGLGLLILKVMGFVLKDGVIEYAYLIALVVISLLYSPIVESTKLNKTLGKKALGL